MSKNLTFEEAREIDARFQTTLARKVLMNKNVEGILFSYDPNTPIRDCLCTREEHEGYKADGILTIYFPENIEDYLYTSGKGIIFKKVITQGLGKFKYNCISNPIYNDEATCIIKTCNKEGEQIKETTRVTIPYPNGQENPYTHINTCQILTYDDYVNMLKEYDDGELIVICDAP